MVSWSLQKGEVFPSCFVKQQKDVFFIGEKEMKTITGVITKIAQGVVEGNSHYFVMVEGSEEIFDVSVVEHIDIIRYDIGEEITMEYKEGEEVNLVLSVK